MFELLSMNKLDDFDYKQKFIPNFIVWNTFFHSNTISKFK